ncbi:MAG: ABATE domain-containing protein [Phycisphaerales bacterium]
MVTAMDEIWIELLNSDWHDYLGGGRAEDRLDDPQWVRTFLAAWDLPDRIVSAKATRLALGELRSVLRGFVDRAVAEESLTQEELEALNVVLAAEPVVRRLELSGSTYRLRLDPVRTSLRAVLAEIAKSFADMLIEGDLARIKLCENSDCRWVFYDRSRSRTRRWCEGASGCGNLLKVRRFRERQKKKRGKMSSRSTRRD